MAKDLIIVLGPQGSGKSTQAKILAEKLHLPLFITGDQLRAFAQGTSPKAQQFKQIIASGQLVPNETVYEIIDSFLHDQPTAEGVVFDGFPRSLDQCQFLADLAKKNDWQITGINVDISNQTSIDRLLLRAKKAVESGQKPRNDDKLDVIKDRLEIFRQETKPVLDWLDDHYRLLNIDGEPNIETVTQEIFDRLPKS